MTFWWAEKGGHSAALFICGHGRNQRLVTKVDGLTGPTAKPNSALQYMYLPEGDRSPS
jgi:hypothetical protein